MTMRHWLAFGLLLLFSASMGACGSETSSEDGDFEFERLDPDKSDGVDADANDAAERETSEATPPDGDKTEDEAASEEPDSAESEAADDRETDEDPPEAEVADLDSEAPADGDTQDAVKTACDTLEACPADQVCNLAIGFCETRGSKIDTASALLTFNPKLGRRGDLLLIDGARFFHSMAGNFKVKVWVGSTQATAADYVAWDENRLLLRIPNGSAGNIGVQTEDGAFLRSTDAFGQAPAGVLACDGTTPAAGNKAASSPTGLGPYAAAYLDMNNEGIRLYYPGQCGALRRPGVAGRYPLIAILHGNGAGHVNYEYLGQLLASRGFVVINPPSDHTNQYDAEVIAKLHDDISTVLGKNLESIHPALAGLSTSDDIGFICHSRGCGRLQEMLGDFPALGDTMKAAAFLGSAGNNTPVPGHVLSMGATKDGQSFPAYYNGQYDCQPAPRWEVVIQGGNHSLFADAKIYYSFDGVPTVTRQRQLFIVASFVTPLMEHAFGLPETAPSWLSTPPSSPDYTFVADP